MRDAILSGDTRPLNSELKWEISGAPRYSVPLIDLHSRRRAERLRTTRTSRRYLALAAALVLCLPVMVLPLTIRFKALHGRLVHAEADASQWRQRSQSLTKAESALDVQLSDWTRYLASRDRHLACNDLCTTLAARLPANVYLEHIQIDTKAEPERIALTGCAESMTALQNYARSLMGIPFFTNIRLSETTPFTAMGPDALRFHIEACGNGALNLPKE